MEGLEDHGQSRGGREHSAGLLTDRRKKEVT